MLSFLIQYGYISENSFLTWYSPLSLHPCHFLIPARCCALKPPVVDSFALFTPVPGGIFSRFLWQELLLFFPNFFSYTLIHSPALRFAFSGVLPQKRKSFSSRMPGKLNLSGPYWLRIEANGFEKGPKFQPITWKQANFAVIYAFAKRLHFTYNHIPITFSLLVTCPYFL